jgi:hypothetical protein
VTVTDPAAKHRASSDGQPVERLLAEAEIFFAHLDKSRSKQLFGDHNFVFTGELKNMLGLARLKARNTTDQGVPQ